MKTVQGSLSTLFLVALMFVTFGLLGSVQAAASDPVPATWKDAVSPDTIATVAALFSGVVVFYIVNVLKLSSAVQGTVTRVLSGLLNLIVTQVLMALFGYSVWDGGGIIRATVSAAFAFVISWGAALGQRQAAASAMDGKTITVLPKPGGQ
jgi:hypothetical protein